MITGWPTLSSQAVCEPAAVHREHPASRYAVRRSPGTELPDAHGSQALGGRRPPAASAPTSSPRRRSPMPVTFIRPKISQLERDSLARRETIVRAVRSGRLIVKLGLSALCALSLAAPASACAAPAAPALSASVGMGGEPANDASGEPEVSSNGVVVRTSDASDLLPADQLASRTCSPASRRTSRPGWSALYRAAVPARAPASGPTSPAMAASSPLKRSQRSSPRTRTGWPTFTCSTSRRERLQSASVSSAGVQGNSHSQLPSISDDGRWVAFDSEVTNLAPDGNEGELIGVYLRYL